ncbi:serine phosphatase RsbU, regulator of sigma subunit [Bernardetia litoralis DSM 6794]|uniref:Serine phosphatase RsbU, regulator of sigma subunit n=1 Tax=Bernardetia litoralis (strain ATCC 23117 / DSM 6794 / NBRC 15988 / NCIMB 1366 / Fx l1 / Sio-4) TaxID=880071 RepID=I4ALE3_BERLS|nr:SpoIIE family protein phosphatase [Bernardetia litoralis]AFM04778.1 serine phosphatase RsbU, regulator of sigma subunit [Bernardetia litoralis DSM 6794]
MNQKNISSNQSNKKFRGLKNKLQLYFSVYLLLTALIIGSIFMFYEKRERIQNSIDLLTELHIDIQALSGVEKDFFTYETINTAFFETEESEYLDIRTQKLYDIQRNLIALKNRKELRNDDIDKKLFKLKQSVGEYEVLFERLVAITQRKGHKDYGKVGQMRKFIHEIENSDLPFKREKLLMIRRHEKDFMIRKEEDYINKLSLAVQDLRADIRETIKDKNRQKEMLSLLQNYQRAFLDMVDYEKQIGLNIHEGMRFETQQKAYQIADIIAEINKEGNLQAAQITFGIKYTLAVVVLMCFILGMIVSYLISKKLSLPVRQLSKSIHKVIKNDFSENYSINPIITNDEIGWLSKDFDLMLNKIQNSLHETQEKTQEIERSQVQIMDSIRYARQIQDAVLPTENELNEYFTDSFAVYKPQKIVSGDFYWVYRKKRKTFVAVVDCTGHGVPGAFMSMIGQTLLNKIIGQSKIYDPAMILEVLHLEIQHALKQNEGKNDDGMEVAILAIETTDLGKQVTFSGAHRPLYYIHDGQFLKIKGNNRSIGGKQKQENNQFITHSIHLQAGDILYLTTDGFADQNNSDRVKYGTQRLTQFLEQIKDYPFATQKIELIKEFEAFKNGELQRDDMTILGLRV